MHGIFRKLLVLLAGALLLACDQQGQLLGEAGLNRLAKGISTEADVRMVMGQPDTVREEEGGARTLEYPTGPEGVRTWMFAIDRDGKLQDYEQVLTLQNFARIQPGLEREAVRRMLGKPGGVTQFRRQNEEVWEWRFVDGVDTRTFNVHFDIGSGKVKQTSITEVHTPG